MTADVRAKFAQLQSQLERRWSLMRADDTEPRDVVVVPSLSLDGIPHSHIHGMLHYEERMLFTLNLLRQPRTRLVYVTSEPLNPIFVEYILSLIRGIPTAHCRQRLTLLCAYDASPTCLSDKILARRRLVEQIRSKINPDRAYLTSFNASNSERRLAVELGVPLYGTDPDLIHLGTKSGSRQAFREAGIDLPAGAENLRTMSQVASAIATMWEEDPDLTSVVVKQNDGFSGLGNAVFSLATAAAVHPRSGAGHTARVAAIEEALPATELVDRASSWADFTEDFAKHGGIVEAFIRGKNMRTPSVQLRISPAGNVQPLSTHEQVVSGEHGQIYAGCTFPADAAYRLDLQADAMRVAEVLRDKGAVGRLAVDFMTVEENPGVWRRCAIEVNLRLGGTTHPMMLMRMLNDGAYDPEFGVYRTARGEERCYRATDALEKDQYKGLLVEDVLDIGAMHGLHYLPWTDSGVVFHLTGALSQYGKLGLTAIGPTVAEATARFDDACRVLDEETS